MNCLKSYPVFLISICSLFFFIFSTHFSLSYGATDLDIQNPYLQDLTGKTTDNSTYIILAANRTRRRDPSNDFKFYTGGWNITDPHYFKSVTFSAIGPIIAAALWFIGFGLCLLCLLVRRCCCRTNIYGYSRTAYFLSVFFLVIFTLAAVGGIIFIYFGQAKFQESIIDTATSVVKEAQMVVLKLKHLLDNLLAAKVAGFKDIPVPTDIQNNIDQAENTINMAADRLNIVTRDNSREIRSLFNPLRVAIICVATAMLVLAVLGSLLSVLGRQRIVYCFMVPGWILITVTFILGGVFLLLHSLVTDTCVAMDEWLQNPEANSALERIIPKVDDRVTQDISAITKTVTFSLISMVNGEIFNVSNANLGPIAGPLFYNQTGPLIPLLCNPYEANLIDRQCAPEEVTFANVSQVWRNYVCEVSPAGICTTMGRLTPDQYTQATAAANISNILYTGMPFVLDLMDATYLKETFSEISKMHCPSLEIYSRWMYIIFCTSSSAVMLSIVLWVIYARERRHRTYSKRISRRESEILNMSTTYRKPSEF